jgi:hypothetical protein
MMKRCAMLRSAVKDSHADPVLPEVNRWHQRQEYVVQGDGDRSCDLVGLKYPRHPDGKQRFQTPKRGKSKENSDGRTEGDRMGRIRDRHQGHVMRGQPPF